MNSMRLTDSYRIDSFEYEYALRRRRNIIRRKRELKKHVVLFLLGVIFALFLSFSYHTIVSNADDSLDDVSYKYYTSILIKSGDTLWTLAEEYGDDIHYKSNAAYIEEVKQINHLAGDQINAGEYLIVPYYSSEFVLVAN